MIFVVLPLSKKTKLHMLRVINHMIIVLVLAMPILVNAQQKDWKESSTNNGKVKVRYTVDALKDNQGTERIIAEYTVTTTTGISISKAEKLLRDAANYKKFLDNTEVSKTVGTTSPNNWLIYMYIDAPWPVPNSDCVQQVTINRTEKELTVTMVSKPDAYPLQDDARMEISDTKYHFIEKAPGKVDVTITGKFAPMGPVTKFLLETWFPKGPTALLERLIEQINNQ